MKNNWTRTHKIRIRIRIRIFLSFFKNLDILEQKRSKKCLNCRVYPDMKKDKERYIKYPYCRLSSFFVISNTFAGASAALIETLASVGSYLNINPETHYAVGTELNVSHISSAHRGKVTGEARPIKIGRNIHFWNVEIKQDEKLVSTGRCSLFIQARRK